MKRVISDISTMLIYLIHVIYDLEAVIYHLDIVLNDFECRIAYCEWRMVVSDGR